MRFASAAVFCAATLVFAAAPAFAAVRHQPSCLKEDESELGKLMGKMGRHFKTLKKEVGDADKKESNAAHFAAIAELADQCKAHPPATAETEADKKLYADQMDQVAAAAKAGAEAAKAGKAEAARKAVEDLKKAMAAGHKKFKKED